MEVQEGSSRTNAPEERKEEGGREGKRSGKKWEREAKEMSVCSMY